MPWKKLLANGTGSIDDERRQLAKIGKQLGGKALEAIATIVRPDNIVRWHAKPVARKFDGSRYRRSAERPPVPPGSRSADSQIRPLGRTGAGDIGGLPAP